MSHHWVGPDLFTDPRFLGGIAKLELLRVWMPPAVVLVVLGCLRSPSRRAVGLASCWLAVIGVYYIITSRTTHGRPGVYYHVVAVPPVALLFGAGVDAIANVKLCSAMKRWVLYGVILSLCATYLWELGADYSPMTDRAKDPLYACAKTVRTPAVGTWFNRRLGRNLHGREGTSKCGDRAVHVLLAGPQGLQHLP